MSQSSSKGWVVAIFLLASQHLYASDTQSKVSSDKINSDIQVSGPSEKSKGGIQDVISPASSKPKNSKPKNSKSENLKSEINTPAPEGKVTSGTNTPKPAKKTSPTSKGSAASAEGTTSPAVGNGVKPPPPVEHKHQGTKTPVADSNNTKTPAANSSSTKGIKPPAVGGVKPKTPVEHKPHATKASAVDSNNAKTPTVNSGNTKTPNATKSQPISGVGTKSSTPTVKGGKQQTPITRQTQSKKTPVRTGRHRPDTRKSSSTRRGHEARRQRDARHVNQRRVAPPLRENCSVFSPNHLAIVRSRGHWAVVDRAPLLHFSRRRSARRAITVLRHYRMSKQCTIGYPKTVFRYYLANSAAPAGYHLRGEHCASFSPVLLRLVRTRHGRWILAEGRRYLFRFRYNKHDAIKALHVIQKYTFNHSCYVGHGRHIMRYLLQR